MPTPFLPRIYYIIRNIITINIIGIDLHQIVIPIKHFRTKSVIKLNMR